MNLLEPYCNFNRGEEIYTQNLIILKTMFKLFSVYRKTTSIINFHISYRFIKIYLYTKSVSLFHISYSYDSFYNFVDSGVNRIHTYDNTCITQNTLLHKLVNTYKFIYIFKNNVKRKLTFYDGDL